MTNRAIDSYLLCEGMIIGLAAPAIVHTIVISKAGDDVLQTSDARYLAQNLIAYTVPLRLSSLPCARFFDFSEKKLLYYIMSEKLS